MGDAAGPWQFTHTAAHQAWYGAVNALFTPVRFKLDGRVIPRTTFTDPEVASVGLTETEANQQGVACEITRFDLAELDRAIVDSAERGFVKVLTPPGKDTLLGVTIVGEHAGELLAEFVLAMKWNLGLGKIMAAIHAYPTMAEANKYAAGSLEESPCTPAHPGLAEAVPRFPPLPLKRRVPLGWPRLLSSLHSICERSHAIEDILAIQSWLVVPAGFDGRLLHQLRNTGSKCQAGGCAGDGQGSPE